MCNHWEVFCFFLQKDTQKDTRKHGAAQICSSLDTEDFKTKKNSVKR
jgi:hypothetical protein